ncbi:hypothetical protein [Caballeronia sp. INDeC2]|uniref:hypothetical protein n=1 Tax=Caballeronia sp. INDeC2 TaxID=2921747 RepID=UPI0020284A83|nr:hypothetical protein [Caballeronia sp. INDeC2]
MHQLIDSGRLKGLLRRAHARPRPAKPPTRISKEAKDLIPKAIRDDEEQINTAERETDELHAAIAPNRATPMCHPACKNGGDYCLNVYASLTVTHGRAPSPKAI